MIETMFSSNLPDVRLTYEDATGNITERTVTPLGVRRMKTGEPALISYCRMRQAMRTFSLDRLETLNGLDKTDLYSWISTPLERYDLFDHMTTTNSPNCQTVPSLHALQDKIGFPLTEALIWWENDQLEVHADSRIGEYLRSLSGHKSLQGLAILRAMGHDYKEKFNTQKGAIAIKKYLNCYTAQFSEIHRLYGLDA